MIAEKFFQALHDQSCNASAASLLPSDCVRMLGTTPFRNPYTFACSGICEWQCFSCGLEPHQGQRYPLQAVMNHKLPKLLRHKQRTVNLWGSHCSHIFADAQQVTAAGSLLGVQQQPHWQQQQEQTPHLPSQALAQQTLLASQLRHPGQYPDPESGNIAFALAVVSAFMSYSRVHIFTMQLMACTTTFLLSLVSSLFCSSWFWASGIGS